MRAPTSGFGQATTGCTASTTAVVPSYTHASQSVDNHYQYEPVDFDYTQGWNRRHPLSVSQRATAVSSASFELLRNSCSGSNNSAPSSKFGKPSQASGTATT